MSAHPDPPHRMTQEAAYYERLRASQERWWKKALPVQWPYQWKLKRQDLGRTLDVGCGLGRNLRSLDAGSLGVDHNLSAIEHARRAGLDARSADTFRAAPGEQFDSILFAHVLEHMTRDEALELVRAYLPYLRADGTVLIICPQERGFSSDPTHVWFATMESLNALLGELGLTVTRNESFPLPRSFGRLFIYNEIWVRAIHRPASAQTATL